MFRRSPFLPKAFKVRLANCRKMEYFVARQYGFVSRLSVAAPSVAAEWDAEKNPTSIFPDIVSTGALVPYWWKCSSCGNSFQMSPEKRTVRGRGCPRCEEASKMASAEIDAAAESASSMLPGERRASLRPRTSGKQEQN